MFLDDRASQNNTMTVRELLSVFGQIVPLDTIAPNASKPGMRRLPLDGPRGSLVQRPPTC